MRGRRWPREAARPALLNAADEVAVEAFLRGKIGFLEIFDWIAWALEQPEASLDPTDPFQLAAIEAEFRRKLARQLGLACLCKLKATLSIGFGCAWRPATAAQGVVHWRREKFVPRGGPDGGDGGDGGSVWMEGDPQKWTLLDVKYRRVVKAPSGQPGRGQCQKGASGGDVILAGAARHSGLR
ncbi:MAG: hypothetical protein KatS3mg026_0928 [Bacteroidia bacterium]|nr:MAG: hypothetical protein KatS3mg026_0928 [Bacteroidia bacterium]